MALHPVKYAKGFNLACHPAELEAPKGIKSGRMIFVNSMSDTFHPHVTDQFINAMFDTMVACPQHLFQVLTKRSQRLLHRAASLPWPSHIWQGVTVEHQDYVDRIDHLRATPAAVKFLSLEPLLGPLPNLNLNGIHWVIVGGESGPGARPISPSWVRDIRDQCVEAGVDFFFKQWGGVRKKAAERTLDGCIWNEIPPHHIVAKTRKSK
jgi:protein gp37